MTKILTTAAVLVALVVSANAGDALITWEGEVIMGSAVFQKVRGRVTKLRIEGRVGECPFSTSGKYGGAGDAILSVCQKNSDRCKVRAWVGKVPGTVLAPSGMPGCCDLWIKEVEFVEKIN